MIITDEVLETLLEGHFHSQGVTVDQARRALRVRIETLHHEPCDDGWEPEYSDAMEKEFSNDRIADGVYASVLGSILWNKLKRNLIKETSVVKVVWTEKNIIAGVIVGKPGGMKCG